MAFSKIKQMSTGNTGEYHRIVQLNCNYDRNDAVCTVQTYKDQIARDEGKATLGDDLKIDLKLNYHDEVMKGDDTSRNTVLATAYKVLKEMAQVEADKPDTVKESDNTVTNSDKNQSLAWWADAEDV